MVRNAYNLLVSIKVYNQWLLLSYKVTMVVNCGDLGTMVMVTSNYNGYTTMVSNQWFYYLPYMTYSNPMVTRIVTQ